MATSAPSPAPALRKLPRTIRRDVDLLAAPPPPAPRVCYVPADPDNWTATLAPGVPLPPAPAIAMASSSSRPNSASTGAAGTTLLLAPTATKRGPADNATTAPSSTQPPAHFTPPSPPLTHEADLNDSAEVSSTELADLPAEPAVTEKTSSKTNGTARPSSLLKPDSPPQEASPKPASPVENSAPPSTASRAGSKSPNPDKSRSDAGFAPSNASEKRGHAVAASLFEDDDHAQPTLKRPRTDEKERSVSPRPPSDAQLEAQRAVLARLTAKMDLDKGFESDNHSETSVSPRRSTSNVTAAQLAMANATAASAAQSGARRRDNRYLSQKSMNPGTDAVDVIREEIDKYVVFGSDVPAASVAWEDEDNAIVLEFPGDGASEKFPLIEPRKLGEVAPVAEIYNATKLIVQHVVPASAKGELGDINSGILRSIIKACHKKDREGLKQALEEWSAKMRKLKENNVFALCELQGPAAPQPLINHILEQAYSRTVAPYSELLNQYRAFGNNVYGEVKSSLVREFIKNAKIQPHHVFIDMGSGIGNVVLQVAGEVLAESHGIEVMDIPAKLANRQLKEFLIRMRYYAQPCGKLRLRHGNFLEDKETDEVLKRADVVFVNNFAFDPNLNQRILAKFLDLKEGARVISLKSFVHQDRRINFRNADALESIFRVKEYHFGMDMVSWTNEGGRYFIHTVDRSLLSSYFKDGNSSAR